MSVSSELLCSFELLKPLDSNALKSHIKKGRNKRNQLLNSPVRSLLHPHQAITPLTFLLARKRFPTECLMWSSVQLVERRSGKTSSGEARITLSQAEGTSSSQTTGTHIRRFAV